GESAKPYQPESYYNDTYVRVGVPHVYETSMDEQQYRRGLYTFWKRSFLHPSLLAFDAPPREECTAVRDVSNTPQQALVLLNDPTYVEAARTLAERVLREGGRSDRKRLQYAYRLALNREPDKAEAELLLDLRESHARDFKEAPEDAQELIGVGLRPAPEDLDP